MIGLFGKLCFLSSCFRKKKLRKISKESFCEMKKKIIFYITMMMKKQSYVYITIIKQKICEDKFTLRLS